MKLPKTYIRLAAAALALGLAATAGAQTVLIDFGNNSSFRGVSQVGVDSLGHTWTSVWSGAFYMNLADSSGAATTIDFGFTTVGGTDSYNGPAGVTSTPPTVGEIAAAAAAVDVGALGMLGGSGEVVIDYYTNSTFQIQGLTVGQQYDIKLFGSHKFGATTTRYTAYTDGTFTTPVSFVDLVVNPGGGGTSNSNQFATATLTPNASGIIFMGFADAAGVASGYLNTMSITPVPEPASCMLLIGSFTAFAVFRRRRN